MDPSGPAAAARFIESDPRAVEDDLRLGVAHAHGDDEDGRHREVADRRPGHDLAVVRAHLLQHGQLPAGRLRELGGQVADHVRKSDAVCLHDRILAVGERAVAQKPVVAGLARCFHLWDR